MKKKSTPVPWAMYRTLEHGFGVITWLLATPVLLIALLILAVIFYEGRKAYWDAQVKEMCVKDGGVTIYQKLYLTRAEVQLLGTVGEGMIGVPVKELAKPSAPAFAELKRTEIHDGEPSITRTESAIVQGKDRVVVARWVSYVRSGGDFPSYAHPSSFRCPELKKITEDLQTLFVIDGAK